ncbi:hypothetical protein GCM10022267_79470 [Lentzea roselyniae]|uniref:Uncharacterized protein n=1 Tax=Lentzea roselyniae TaxID=531940 RepID=A0ABP7C9L2_9PSEU
MRTFITNTKSVAATISAVAAGIVLSAGTAHAVTPGNIEVCGTDQARITVKFLDRGGYSLTPAAKCHVQALSSKKPEQIEVSAQVGGRKPKVLGSAVVDIRKGVKVYLTSGTNPGFFVK